MRRRLTWLVGGTMCLVLVAFLVPLALMVRSVAENRAVATATAQLQAVAPLLATESDPRALERAVQASPRPVTVFLPDGRQLGVAAEVTPAVRLAARGESLTAVAGQGREVVIAVQGLRSGTAVIRTVVAEDELTGGVRRTWLSLGVLAAALVLLGLLTAHRLARSLVNPIVDLSRVSLRLARAELTARARPAGPPEVRDVAIALNHLAGRIQSLLDEEREQVADLSHRLRTPLTALRLEVDACPPQSRARLTAGLDALERSVTALINQARHRSASHLAAPGSCDATTVVRERAEFWAVLAEDTERPMRVVLAGRAFPVGVSAEDLAAAVDALLGNVFAHTPDGTALTVILAASGTGSALLTVSDDGPGFVDLGTTPTDRGVSGAGSTGLGLDIARRTARTAGGTLHIGASRSGGAYVTLELPVTER